MPPLPKPPGQRRRRNAGQSQWAQLPADGRKGEIPDLPEGEWHPSTLKWWLKLWESPMATMYSDADHDSLLRLAHLKDEFNHGDRQQTSAIKDLEDRFGLSPKARRQLQWEIAKGEVVDLPTPKKDRKLRAVEG